MAEGRMLKRRISNSKKLAALSSDSPRLLYTWLIPWLDIADRHSADPDIIKGSVFPKIKSWTNKKIVKCLEELHAIGLIVYYEVEGEMYLQFIKTLQKKYPDREAVSIIPKPPKEAFESCGRMSTHAKIKLKEKKLKEKKLNSSCSESNGIDPEPIDLELTQLLIDRMAENNPNSAILRRLTETRQLDWVNQCRLMRERDERDPEEIRLMIEFSQSDDFWKSNILSMAKLRKQFDQLWLKAKRKAMAGKPKMDGIISWLKKKGELKQ